MALSEWMSQSMPGCFLTRMAFCGLVHVRVRRDNDYGQGIWSFGMAYVESSCCVSSKKDACI